MEVSFQQIKKLRIVTVFFPKLYYEKIESKPNQA